MINLFNIEYNNYLSIHLIINNNNNNKYNHNNLTKLRKYKQNQMNNHFILLIINFIKMKVMNKTIV